MSEEYKCECKEKTGHWWGYVPPRQAYCSQCNKPKQGQVMG